MTMDKEQTRARIGARISSLRIQAGLTQQQLADRSGLQRTHIGRIEAGKYDVTLPTLQSIAEALGMTFDLVDPKLEGLTKLKTLT